MRQDGLLFCLLCKKYGDRCKCNGPKMVYRAKLKKFLFVKS